MAEETRAQLYAKILANLPDNTTEQITPATDRAVENAEVESCYNLLDDDATNVTYNPGDGADWVDPDPTEVGGALDDLAGRVTTIEGQGFQTAVQTPYTPASVGGDWLPEGDPTEVGGALDILATRTSKNPSQDVAFVSNDGDDLTGERGNPLKPYATILAGVNAVGGNGTVKVLGGTYTPTSSITTSSDFLLDISNCIINFAAGATFVLNGNNVTLLAYNAKVTSSDSGTIATVSSTNLKIFGGEFIGVGVPAYKDFSGTPNTKIVDAKLTSDTTTIQGQKMNIVNCEIDSSSTGVKTVSLYNGESKITNSKITGGQFGVEVLANSTLDMNNCFVSSNDSALLTSAATTSGSRNLNIKNSTLEGVSEAVQLWEQTENVNIVDCILNAPTSISLRNLERLNNDVTFIQGCKLLASTQVVNEVSYQGTDTGTLNFVNCSTITAITTNAKVIEFNTYLNANL